MCGDPTSPECARSVDEGESTRTPVKAPSKSPTVPPLAGPSDEFVCPQEKDCGIFKRACASWCTSEASNVATCATSIDGTTYPRGTILHTCDCYALGSRFLSAAILARSFCTYEAAPATQAPTDVSGGKLCGDCACAYSKPKPGYSSWAGYSDYCQNPAFKGDSRFCFCSVESGGGVAPSMPPSTPPTNAPGECKPGEEPAKPTQQPSPTKSPIKNAPTAPISGNPTTGECPSDAKQQIIDAGDMPASALVGYVGGSNWDASFKWDDMSRTGHYDALVVGFANFWNKQCSGPTEDGMDGATPSLNTASCAVVSGLPPRLVCHDAP